MANLKISELDDAAALDGTEKIPGVQSASNVALTPNQIKTLFGTYSDYVPVFGGFSVDPTVVYARYLQIGKMVHVVVLVGAGTSNATTYTMTLPVTASSLGTQSDVTVGAIVNNSASQTTPGRITTVANSTTLNLYTNQAGAAWTGSGTKGAGINFWYMAE